MEVLGRDVALEAYRVSIDGGRSRIVGLVPESIIRDGLAAARLPHHTAYEWIARHERAIEAALRARQEGRGAIRPPFDRVTLAEEN